MIIFVVCGYRIAGPSPCFERLRRGLAMAYRLFYTDYDITEAQYRACKPTYMAYRYNELDDALGKARQIKEHGGVPCEIEDDGVVILDRYEIAKTLRIRGRELVGRPKVY